MTTAEVFLLKVKPLVEALRPVGLLIEEAASTWEHWGEPWAGSKLGVYLTKPQMLAIRAALAQAIEGYALPVIPEKSGKYPIDRPCSACSGGDSAMEYHDHAPPFRKGYGPGTAKEEIR